MHRAAAVAALALTLTVAGCGTRTGPGLEPGAGQWTSEHLAGTPSVDSPTLLAADGDDVLVLMVSDDGVLQSHVSVDGGAFEAGEPLETGERWISMATAVRLDDGAWYALGSGGSEVVGDDEELRNAAFAFRSDDGLEWRQVEVSGFTGAVDVHDLAVVDGAVVAVGAYRTAKDPDMGGFEAQAWVSEDARRFTEVELPGVPPYRSYDDESAAGDLTVSEGRLLAAGRIGRHATVWTSTDAGRHWTRVEDPVLREAYDISGLHAQGATVVATTSGTRTSAIRSTDGGETWAPVAALPLGAQAEGWAPLWAGGGRFLTLTGIDDMSWSEPEVCYADLDRCGKRPEPALVASDSGGEWTRVDTSGLGVIDQVAGTDDGRMLVLTGDGGGGRTVHTWPGDAALPEATAPAAPETVGLVTVPEDGRPEPGVRYHAPMYVHCGMRWFWLGETTWRRTDDGPGLETGAGDDAPTGWPVVGQTVYGYATLGENGVLEYSIGGGEVIATYEEAEGAPACA